MPLLQGPGQRYPLPIITTNAASALELTSPPEDRHDLWIEGWGYHSWKYSIPRTRTLDRERRSI